MKKKILIGSIIAVVLLLLMPSIPAIQQKTIEDKAYNDLVEQINDLDLNDIKDIMTLGDDIKFPNLFSLILWWLTFRGNRGILLWALVGILYGNSTPFLPLIYLRGTWLLGSTIIIGIIIQIISYILGWNWDLF